MDGWSRKQLWSEVDAERATAARVHAWVAAAMAVALVGWLALTHVSCTELYYVEEDRRVPATTARAECNRDEDCVLMPSVITCCGECEPAPPFEAVSRASAQARARAVDDDCFPAMRFCDPPACPVVPEGCEARAVCVAGTCSVTATDRCLFH